MKINIMLLLSVVTLIAGCNNDKTNHPTETAAPVSASPGTATVAAKEEELQSLTPLTTEQLVALLPTALSGGQLSAPSSGEATGTAYAKGIYPLNDSTAIELTLFDCGGNGGAGFYKFQFMNMLNAEPSSEDEEKKVIDYKGGKAIEQFDNNSYFSTFTYMDGRILLSLQSEALNVEGLKKAAREITIK